MQRVFPALSPWTRAQGHSVRSWGMCPLKGAMAEPGGKPGKRPQGGLLSQMLWSGPPRQGREPATRRPLLAAQHFCRGAGALGRWGAGPAVRSQGSKPVWTHTPSGCSPWPPSSQPSPAWEPQKVALALCSAPDGGVCPGRQDPRTPTFPGPATFPAVLGKQGEALCGSRGLILPPLHQETSSRARWASTAALVKSQEQSPGQVM